ncbi:MAG: FAD-dependent oxidoreductase, partial [Chitinophagales bacterium]|nr:FAD-dependent oxidoreductase [Chitinophagales bacterium]
MKANNHIKDGNLAAGKNLSCWFEPAVQFKIYPSLSENMETDVVIVGGGLAGLSIAYCLIQAGRKVVLVEDGYIGSGETGRTTAQLVTALDDRYFNMEKIFGEENTKLIAGSHQTAIDFVEHTIKIENIDCDFKRVDGYLFLHPSDEKESLKKELEAASRSGIDVTELDQVPGIPDEGKCIRFANQAQFHPLKYLLGLCKAIEEKGGRIFTETHASDINHERIITDKGYIIKAKHVVVATNAPVNDKYAMMVKQWAYRSYVIGSIVKKNSLPEAFWWDTGDHSAGGSAPYHYVRLHAYSTEFDLLICGGEDHVVGLAADEGVAEEDRYGLLEEWTRNRFPIEEIVYRWSGEVLVPMDSIAFIGRNPWDRDNVYIVTGDAGIGMTYCTIAGILITDLITGKENAWEKIYRPSRFTFKASGPFIKMLKDDLVAVLKKWFYTNTSELSDIKKGEGKIVMLEGEKCGAFCDETGQMHIVSAECTHLKCMVNWNKDEQSWDCPCHGSRFTYTGKVINGP